MKFKVTMKDPDTLHDAIYDAVKKEVDAIPNLSDEDKQDLIENRQEAVGKITSEWFEYGEYLSVEIDTESKTATVCKMK